MFHRMTRKESEAEEDASQKAYCDKEQSWNIPEVSSGQILGNDPSSGPKQRIGPNRENRDISKYADFSVFF